MSKIKICGLKQKSDIEFVNELKPEFIGFIFAGKSKRYVSYEKAKSLRSLLYKDIKAVGVFVDEKQENIIRLINEGIIDIIQLHGDENAEYIDSLREKTDVTIIKAFSIKSEEDIRLAENSSADYVLLDSGKGGTGNNFNWEFLNNLRRYYFLAGGLDAENVGVAIKKFNPFAVDVSSGIETDGIKDYNKIKKFIEAVRRETDGFCN